MTYSEAKAEFDLRLYHWAKAKLSHEVESGFTSFCPELWPACRFFQSLTSEEKQALKMAVLQQKHPISAKSPREDFPSQGARLLNRMDEFCSQEKRLRDFAYYRGIETERERFPRAKDLRKMVTSHFKNAFGAQCTPLTEQERRGGGLSFKIKLAGWSVMTDFDFGRWAPHIEYGHSIWTGKWITKEEPAVLFANCLGFRLSYARELGLGAIWDNLSVDEAELACREVSGHCQTMFEALPELLNGLEQQSLTVGS